MKNNYIKPSILPGFMELLPKEQAIFNDIKNKIINIYETNGCMGIDTPIIEKSSVLLAKTGGETEKQVYSFTKGKNDLSLRFDLTVPFARYVAQYYDQLTFPLKKYQLGKVYRGERNQRGRYREFYQLDVDVIGKDKLAVENDAWVISLASKAFKSIELKDYKFKVSNRKILKGILSKLDIDNSQEVMTLVDKYDKIGREKFTEELEVIIGKDKSDYINSVLDIKGSNENIVQKLKNLKIDEDSYKEGVKELEKVVSTLKILGVKDEEFDIDLKIIRGLDYYTGSVFETFLVGNESYGSICSGGRYENLAGTYTNNKLPGVGISIGLTRLFFVLKEIGFVDNYKTKNNIDYLVIPIGDTLSYCGEVVQDLNEKGYKANIYFEDDSLKKKMTYANKIEVKNIILIGEEEVANNEVKVKNMSSGEEKYIPYSEL